MESFNSAELLKAASLALGLILLLVFLAALGIRKVRRGFKEAVESDDGVMRSDSGGRNHSDMSFVFNTFHETLKEINEKKHELIEMHKEAEERVRAMERYNACILESMVSGVMAFDRLGKLTAMNEAAATIMGWPAESNPLGKGYREILRGSDQLRECLKGVLQGSRGVLREEIAYAFRSGARKWLGANASPLKGDNGEMIGATLVFTDLTEVRELQGQVELKNRLAAMGEMSAGIAHEFRNSLGAILGYARLIDRQAGERGMLNEAAEGIITEVKTFDAMLSDFLSFARPTLLQKEPCDLGELVHESLELFREKIESRKIKIETSFDHLIPVQADRNLIRQALTNLVKNALEAVGPEGVIRIVEKKVDNRVELEIEDNGCGISEVDQQKVFEPFFTSKAEGTGLGLAITQKTIVSHQGSLKLESRRGEGTRVLLSLPTDETAA